MDKKEIVVVPNEDILLISNRVYHQSSFEVGHSKMFSDFCNKYEIKVVFKGDDPSQFCALELAGLGHFATIIEKNLAILFVPNEISTNQIEWVKANYRTLNRYDVHGFIYDNEKIIPIEEDEEMINPLKEIYSIMRKKYKKTKEGDDYASRIKY